MNMYYAFEVRYGDNNDQFVADIVVAAPTRELAFETIEASVRTRVPDVEIDGDDMVLMALWWKAVEGCEEDPEGHTHPQHEDYLLMGESDTEAEALKYGASHHDKWAPLRYEAKA